MGCCVVDWGCAWPTGLPIMNAHAPPKIRPTTTNIHYIIPTPPQNSTKKQQEKVAKDPSVKAAVLISAKPDNFIAGADIRFIDTVEDFSTLKDGPWSFRVSCTHTYTYVCMGILSNV